MLDYEDVVVGYLQPSPHFVCGDCLCDCSLHGGGAFVPVYRVNIGQYGQGCHECHKLVVEPSTPAWPELFDVGCKYCKPQQAKPLYDYAALPESLRGGMQRYIEHHIEPGGFLVSVLSNDLIEAFRRADNLNRLDKQMFGLLAWLTNEAPAACWGSRETVKSWLEGGHR